MREENELTSSEIAAGSYKVKSVYQINFPFSCKKNLSDQHQASSCSEDKWATLSLRYTYKSAEKRHDKKGPPGRRSGSEIIKLTSTQSRRESTQEQCSACIQLKKTTQIPQSIDDDDNDPLDRRFRPALFFAASVDLPQQILKKFPSPLTLKIYSISFKHAPEVRNAQCWWTRRRIFSIHLWTLNRNRKGSR